MFEVNKEEKEKEMNEKQKSFITKYRISILLMTFVSILAVDFQIYPRRLAKTEQFGISLMDVGVGCFVFVNSLTSKVIHQNWIRGFFNSLLSSSPLFILGFARVILYFIFFNFNF